MKKYLFLLLILFLFQKISNSQNNPIQYLDPVPGANYVNKETNIIIKPFFKPTAGLISDNSIISVKGSKSGIHRGSMILSSDGQVIIFKPFMRFELSDTVFVKISSKLTNNYKSYNYYFVIKQREPNTLIRSSLENELGSFIFQNQSLFSNLIINGDTLPADFPKIKIDTLTSTAAGYIFIDNFSDPSYLMILENTGNPIFYRKMSKTTADFRVQPNGLLTYFSYASNKFYALNGYYQVVDSFYTGNLYTTDVHELRVLNDRSAYLLSYDAEIVDMSHIVTGGDTAAVVTGLIVQQIDSSKNVIFQWRSWDHFQITDATHENLLAHLIDYVHGNAIEIDNDGNILISSRHLDEITKINRLNGNIIWRLGGKNNQFTFPNDSIRFSHQHNIRRLANGNITLYDNGNYHTPSFSRAVEYNIDEQNKTASLVWQYRNTPSTFGSTMGSVQRLDNGNTLIGWGGTNPTVTEVTNSGSKVFQLNLNPGVMSYRGFRSKWSPTAPALKFPANGETNVITTPKLFWFKMPEALSYGLQIASDTGFNNILLNVTNLISNNYIVPIQILDYGTKYYWRVNSVLASATTPWSLVWNFKTITSIPGQVILCSPLNGAIKVSTNPTFIWNKAVEYGQYNIKNKTKTKSEQLLYIQKYMLVLSTDINFSNIFFTDSTITDTMKIVSGLNFSTTYYWKVKAYNELGWGNFGFVWYFTTTPPPPTAPIMITPENNSIIRTLTPTFSWNSSPDADSYRLQISSSSGFSDLIFDTSGLNGVSFKVPEGKLSDNSTYYWRMNASNIAGSGLWSSAWSFTTLLSLSANLKMYLEGFWDGSQQITDTVRIYLASSITPYEFIDSAKVILSVTGTAFPTFSRAPLGNYYLVIKHRNHLETWSRTPQEFLSGMPVNYDFTTDSTKAYGINMKKVGNVWALIVGDANQDGSIDAVDVSVFIPQYGNIGYLSCDFNGDNSVDALDVAYIIANYGFTKVVPTLKAVPPEIRKQNQMIKKRELDNTFRNKKNNNLIKSE